MSKRGPIRVTGQRRSEPDLALLVRALLILIAEEPDAATAPPPDRHQEDAS